MGSYLKKNLGKLVLSCLVIIGFSLSLNGFVEATPPKYEEDFTSHLKSYVLNPDNYGVKTGQTFRQNVVALFYPSINGQHSTNKNSIYKVIRDITLGVMIIFLVMAGATLLFKKPEESKKQLTGILYILLGGVFIYGANRLFGEVLNFNAGDFTPTDGADTGIEGVTQSFIGKRGVLFVILSAIKAFAFFLAIIMIVLTGFKVMAAGDGEKGKKLVKGIINVVVALLIIKGVDFIYYLAADSSNFIANASDFIINVAKVFGYIYGVLIVIMVIVAGYLYITDGGNGNNFKKAGNILLNILLSALALFGFLLIVYQIFAEFQTGGDAVIETTSFIIKNYI